jgi:glutathione S-transferase
MLRYAGQLAGLYPSDPYQALLVDEMVGAIEDVITAIVPSIREQDEAKRVRAVFILASCGA